MPSIEHADDIDPSALRLFLAVAELGSVSRAAARMRIAQPSATAKLQKLERRLGVALVERTATGSIPTVAGARLLPACAAAVAAISDVVDAAWAVRDAGDVLRVAATRHVAEHHLPVWVERLGPTPISVIEHDTLGVARAVRDGEAMIGLVEGPERPIGLAARPAATEHLIQVVGRRHEWSERTAPVTFAELAATTNVLPRAGSGLRDVVMAAFAAAGSPEPADLIETTNTRTALLTAIAGGGVAHVPACIADAAARLGTVTPLRTTAPPVDLPIRVVWRGDRPATQIARELVAAITH